MNRLIIVGNGFDKAHGLNSDYCSFIKDYLYNAIVDFIEKKRYDDLLISINIDKSKSYTTENIYTVDIDNENIFNTIQVLQNKKRVYPIEFKCKSEFFEEICVDAEKKWVDIERTYYKHLIKLFDTIKKEEKIIESTLEPVRQLNNQMNHLKVLLNEYLYMQQQEQYISSSVNSNTLFREFMKETLLSHTWNDLLKNHQEKTKNEQDTKIIDDRIYPEKVMILNFNYTNPFNGYSEKYDVINIHGQLNSRSYPMVFGYGDERDEKYLELEKSEHNEFLENIKSFAYFQNKNYDNLLGFIELNDFEVWIAGHSCGLSDKTLLAQIFEHKFCKSIRVFYYESDGNDNYNEIVYNIARVMGDKIKMRGIVTPKHHFNKFGAVAGIIQKSYN